MHLSDFASIYSPEKLLTYILELTMQKPLASLRVHPLLIQHLHERLLRSARLPSARPTMM